MTNSPLSGVGEVVKKLEGQSGKILRLHLFSRIGKIYRKISAFLDNTAI